MWRVALSAAPHSIYTLQHTNLHTLHSTDHTLHCKLHYILHTWVRALECSQSEHKKKALSSTLLCDIVQQMENCFFSRMQSTMFRTQFLHVSARQHNICCILYAPKGTSSHGVSWGCGICSRVTFSIGNIFHR